jgi:glycosyltransferase involved in cell wall biosynthesis
MHILHVIDALNVGGAERMLVDLANASVKKGVTVSVCITRSGNPLLEYLDKSIPVHVLNRRSRFQFDAMRSFARIVTKHHVDLIHAHGRDTFSFCLFVRALRLYSVPILLHDHFGNIERDVSAPSWFRIYGCRHVERYIGVSRRLADWAVQHGVPSDLTDVLYNALDLGRIAQIQPVDVRRQFNIGPGTIVGIVICGIRFEKGIHILLECLAQLKPDVDLCILIVGGDRDEAYAVRCRGLVTSLGIDHRVRFVGERTDALALAKGSDFGIIPSLSESGPLVLIEYYTCGIPVVATRTGEIAQIIARENPVGFVQPGNIQMLADGIHSLVEIPKEKSQERGLLGREIAERLFSVDRVIKSWHDAYARTIADWRR